MGTWNSRDGIWEPAKEKVPVVNKKGEPEIYEGPDRSAKEYLKEQGVETLGQHFTKDPEIIMRARQLNMTVEEFCQTAYYTEEMRKKDQDAKASIVNLHKDPPRKSGGKFASGGRNTAGGGHYEGDFGDLNDAKLKVK